MSYRSLLVSLPVCIALALPAAAQDWKGMGRMEGQVLDPDGKPVPDVSVKLDLPSRGGGTSTKTDKKGRWALGGIAAGAWSIDFEAPGFAVKKVTVTLASESYRLPPVVVKLEKAAPKGPPPEVLQALEKGDAFFKAGQYAEARGEYEKLLVMKPELAKDLHLQIARCYSQEQNVPKELEYLQKVLDADPTNADIKNLMAQEALKAGMVDQAMALLKTLDESAIKDPNVFFNIGVLLLNAQKSAEAADYFTKSVTVDPAYVDGYFQRGLTYLGLQKYAESKADFQKVMELAPSGPQAETAKKALESLPK